MPILIDEVMNVINPALSLGENKIFLRGSEAVVACKSHNLEVGSSNLPSPTPGIIPCDIGIIPFLSDDNQAFKSPYSTN